VVAVLRKRAALAAVTGATLLVTGCSSLEQPEAERVATTFEDQAESPEARCDLLAPATLATLEQDQHAPCVEAIGTLPLEGGEVRSVGIWGSDAQVRLTGDTLFLTQTDSGWRVVAAACMPREDAPYDCEVDAP